MAYFLIFNHFACKEMYYMTSLRQLLKVLQSIQYHVFFPFITILICLFLCCCFLFPISVHPYFHWIKLEQENLDENLSLEEWWYKDWFSERTLDLQKMREVHPWQIQHRITLKGTDGKMIDLFVVLWQILWRIVWSCDTFCKEQGS